MQDVEERSMLLLGCISCIYSGRRDISDLYFAILYVKNQCFPNVENMNNR